MAVEPAYRSDLVRLHGGNTLTLIPELALGPEADEEPVGVVLTDGPHSYWGYIAETDSQELIDLDRDATWMHDTLRWQLAWLPQVRRMRPGVAWFFVEPHYLVFYSRIARLLRWPMVGWWRALEDQGQAEYLIAFADRDRDGCAQLFSPTVSADIQAELLLSNSYGQEKSPRMLGKLLEHSPAGLVFDPFCGSGTTLTAARRLGRQSVGIEGDAGILARAVAWQRELDGVVAYEAL